ncbi:MAG: phosphatidate cytidylyltransferase [Bacteroidetes bacterium]|nr:MAG: phosphatidate cytidylyltransferase [Bacteroidota bacterium]
MSNLTRRTITGIFLVLLIIFSLVISRYAFSGFFLVITILGLWEFYTLLEKVNIRPNKVLGTIAGAFLFISNALIALELAPLEILLVNFLLVFLVFLLELYRNIPNPFTNVAFTFFGLLYVAVPFALLNYFPNPGFEAGTYNYKIVLGFFFMIWVNDSGAYLVGTTFGKNKLFERVSPKKTWEGTSGGGILCLITVWIIGVHYTEISKFNWFIIGCIVIVLNTYGDLFESMLKRSINTKDSGNLLPGHGGILDRFDGFLMATPFVFVYLLIIS